MYTVFSLHTLCIIVIEIYNWFYLIELYTNIKYGTLGILYQAVKVIVMILDIIMLYTLFSTIRAYMRRKLNQMLTIQPILKNGI